MIIDGADKVESLLITDAMSSNVLSFSKESSRLKRLLIDGAGWVFQFFTQSPYFKIRDKLSHLNIGYKIEVVSLVFICRFSEYDFINGLALSIIIPATYTTS